MATIDCYLTGSSGSKLPRILKLIGIVAFVKKRDSNGINYNGLKYTCYR